MNTSSMLKRLSGGQSVPGKRDETVDEPLAQPDELKLKPGATPGKMAQALFDCLNQPHADLRPE
ncbi:hypothetical protein [Legionella sp. CNM-4043-24]|uniref:hypothetical protein n=1 Tax=Legionella sp. CNM-4043-24 TaxID=3421646 RepID=UPI00403AFBDB